MATQHPRHRHRRLTRRRRVDRRERFRTNIVAEVREAQGVRASRLSVVSYGNERPAAGGHDESS
jgi:hypothetical protein